MRDTTRDQGGAPSGAAPIAEPARIQAFRRIVAEGQRAKIDGTMVDLFSAGAVVKVYDALNEKNRAAFVEWPARKMVLAAFGILNRTGVTG